MRDLTAQLMSKWVVDDMTIIRYRYPRVSVYSKPKNEKRKTKKRKTQDEKRKTEKNFMRFLNLILLGCLLGLLRDYENTFTQGFTNVNIKYKGRIERSTSLGRIGFTQNYLALDVDVGGKNEHNIPEFNILGNISFDIIGSSQEHSELNLFTKPAWADINESPGSNNIDSSKQLGVS